MIVDSSAVIAILRLEPEAADLSDAISAARVKRLTAPGYLEICMVIGGRRADRSINEVDRFIREADIEVIPFTPQAAEVAVQAFLRYGKGRHPAGLNFGDCISYAAAKTELMPLLFKGDDFRLTDIEAAV